MKSITIIGAGLSGTLLTINLLRQHPEEKLKIIWIDRNGEEHMGPAYSTNEEYLLNVPVELMGAYSADTEHFLKWTLSQGVRAKRGDFLPRKLYRKYIQSLLREAIQSKNNNITLERIQDEVTDLGKVNGQLNIRTKESCSFITDRVVLALGNFPPPDPSTKNNQWIQNKRYVQNPWQPELLDKIANDETILFIGTGQTMVDLVTGLSRRSHEGKLTAVSRRGVLPMSQKKVEPYPSFYDELENRRDIATLFHLVRKHIKKATSAGLDPRAVIDSLRPHTIDIWMSLPTIEKKRFLRHAFRYWEIIRSRIPSASDHIIKKLRSSGQLEIVTGRIDDVVEVKDDFRVSISERKTGITKYLSVHWIINCRGANPDYKTIDNKLVKNLMSRKLICCDPSHLGINALPDGNVKDEQGKPSNQLFTLGPAMKGIVWESLATPEIRVQAEKLAGELVADHYL